MFDFDLSFFDLDHAALKMIWWNLEGALLLGYALLGGFDLGVGILLPLAARTKNEQRMFVDAIAPTWDGNQVWLIVAVAVLFAGWPLVYAALFSTAYGIMALLVLALALRPLAFEGRGKLSSPMGQSLCDWGLFLGSSLSVFLFGAAAGSLFLGLPFAFDDDMRLVRESAFPIFFHPLSLISGLASVALAAMHGAAFLLLRLPSSFSARPRQALWVSALFFVAAFSGALWMAMHAEGYHITSLAEVTEGVIDLRAKEVRLAPYAWMDNFHAHRLWWLAPLAALAGALTALLGRGRGFLAFFSTSVAVAGTALTFGFALFPFVLPSSLEPSHSLTIWDAASSRKTLLVMFWAAVVFLPLALFYTAWAYLAMRGKVRVEDSELEGGGY